jgi:hypothetical protein
MLSLLLLVASADTSALSLVAHSTLTAVAAQGTAAPKEKKDSEKKDSEKKDSEKKKEDAPSGFGSGETEGTTTARESRQGGFFTTNPVGRVIAAPVVLPAKLIGRLLGRKPGDNNQGMGLCRK